jgi:hypothetical protein
VWTIHGGGGTTRAGEKKENGEEYGKSFLSDLTLKNYGKPLKATYRLSS